MALIGVLGGLGPAATVDFMAKVVRLTPAERDQDHLPVLVASLPHVPDRSRGILGQGADPLPYLLQGIDLLNVAQVDLVVIPCNSSHHWFQEMSQRSKAPVLHIGNTCVDRLQTQPGARVLVMATRGTLVSGFYQRSLERAGYTSLVPDPHTLQPLVDACIHAIKAGRLQEGGDHLAQVLRAAQRDQGVSVAILACTELPIAAARCEHFGVDLVDSSMTLAQAVVDHARARGWHRPSWVE
jgi:aspartate racemase